jgi:4-hydroxybenzoate polyprenyltransferase
MRAVIQRLASVLQLTRVTGAFAAVANVWFVILWTRAFPQELGSSELVDRPAWIPLSGGLLTALGLYAFGATLNDVVDAKRDRTLRPSRPLASERISLELALSLVVGTLAVSVLGSLLLGRSATVLTVLVALAITGYMTAGRFVPAVGLPLLSVVYAGHMLVPNPGLMFTWPVVLVLLHGMVIGVVTHTMERRVPRLSTRAVLFAVAAWAGCSAWLLSSGSRAGESGWLWPTWVPISAGWWVMGAAGLLAVVCGRRIARLGIGPRSAEKVRRYGTLWPAVYACAWMAGAGRWTELWPLAALTLCGIVGMTLLREAYALVEEPVEFRW